MSTSHKDGFNSETTTTSLHEDVQRSLIITGKIYKVSLCRSFLFPRISRTARLQAEGTGAQTITVIMENHVLLRRRRPADRLAAGAQRAFWVQATESRGGGRRGIHLPSPSLHKLGHILLILCPCQGASPSPCRRPLLLHHTAG